VAPSLWHMLHFTDGGDRKRGTGHRETIKIVGTDIARLDNARPSQVKSSSV